MKQTARIISTYTGDTSGVCSALYELGGMTVMHDASGCNSTYNTHDEPRWYDMDSLVFISALTEIEALMGDDQKLIGDVVRAARELSPRFIALAGTPIPMMTGVDFQAVAMEIERETGIPAFGFATDGMHSYISGASMAFAEAARRLCVGNGGAEAAGELCESENTAEVVGKLCESENAAEAAGKLYESENAVEAAGKLCESENAAETFGKSYGCEDAAQDGTGTDIRVNILGVTPLDFSVNGTDAAMRRALETAGFKIGAVWAMGSTFEEIAGSGAADVNLVVSACGLEAAKVLKERFGTPYVVGTPCGKKFTGKLAEALRRAATDGECEITCAPCGKPAGTESAKSCMGAGEAALPEQEAGCAQDAPCGVQYAEKIPREAEHNGGQTVIIGESVTALSLANALKEETGRGALVLCAVDTAPELLSDGCIQAWDEDDLIPYLKGAARIIADPLYKPICPESARFISLPHEAFSGRIFREEIPELVTGFEQFLAENKLG